MAQSKFTPETRGVLIDRFTAGLGLPDAAREADLHPMTLKGWLQRGRREEQGPFTDFVAAVEDAREKARNRPEPMDPEELARVVSAAARKGNTQAMKLRWEMILADRNAAETEESQEDPLEVVDRLAERRGA